MNKIFSACLACLILGVAHGASGQTTVPTTVPAEMKAGSRLEGRLVKIDGTDLVIQSVGKGPNDQAVPQDVSIATDNNTQFRVDIDRAQLADLKVGMLIVCSSLPAVHDEAARLLVSASSPGASGTIVKIDPEAMVLRLARAKPGDPAEITVKTDDSTRIFIRLNQPHRHGFTEGSHDDLQIGEQVKVVPPSGIASKIFVVVAPDSTDATSRPAR